jgi:hypothetical protein
MKPDKIFLSLPKDFWAHVRLISEHHGYTVRGTHQIKIPSFEDQIRSLDALGMSTMKIMGASGEPSQFGQKLDSYFIFRAKMLNDAVETLLLDYLEAKALFNNVRRSLKSKIDIPMNKQKGKKKQPAFLTGMVNMIIHNQCKGHECDFDPRVLTRITRDKLPLRALARRVDGAFPAALNPVAVWEIKEYYHTTTFGSRVADGVYETLLDGMELEELRENESIDVKHYLFLDSHYTWWECGRSYLCRIIDMLHMGYVDEVLFGKEVVKRLPEIVDEWLDILKEQRGALR